MNTKQKALIITIIAVMALAIIGLAVGLVLVAQQATLNNSMTISYTANNADCTITASAMQYSTTDTSGGTILQVADIATPTTLEDSQTYIFRASSEEATAGTKFDKAELTASGRVVYSFTVTNTANASNLKELKLLANIIGTTATDNITVKMGETEASAIELGYHYTNIGIGGTSKTFVVVVQVTDASADVSEIELSLGINIGYDIPDPDNAPLIVDVSYNVAPDDNVEWGSFRFSTSLFSPTITNYWQTATQPIITSNFDHSFDANSGGSVYFTSVGQVMRLRYMIPSDAPEDIGYLFGFAGDIEDKNGYELTLVATLYDKNNNQIGTYSLTAHSQYLEVAEADISQLGFNGQLSNENPVRLVVTITAHTPIVPET
ncbi:MAG: hypothetical protein E7361_03645 [Clostridiales bacterium]|nr:hypothetical protein [Clostridiales bacterium]